MTTFATTTYAQDNSSLKTINQIEEAYNLCLQDAASTMAMQSCSLEANKKAEKELQVVTNQIYASLDGHLQAGDYSKEDVKEIKARINKSKKTWDAYVLAKCDLQGVEMLGGTGEGIIIFGCYATSTIEYVKNLQNTFGL